MKNKTKNLVLTAIVGSYIAITSVVNVMGYDSMCEQLENLGRDNPKIAKNLAENRIDFGSTLISIPYAIGKNIACREYLSNETR